MSYIKQGFTSGQTLMADHVNHIESGIEELDNKINVVLQTTSLQEGDVFPRQLSVANISDATLMSFVYALSTAESNECQLNFYYSPSLTNDYGGFDSFYGASAIGTSVGTMSAWFTYDETTGILSQIEGTEDLIVYNVGNLSLETPSLICNLKELSIQDNYENIVALDEKVETLEESVDTLSDTLSGSYAENLEFFATLPINDYSTVLLEDVENKLFFVNIYQQAVGKKTIYHTVGSGMLACLPHVAVQQLPYYNATYEEQGVLHLRLDAHGEYVYMRDTTGLSGFYLELYKIKI